MDSWPSPFARVAGTTLGSLTCVIAVAVVVRHHPGPLPGDLGVLRTLQGLGQPVPAIADIVRLVTSTEACIVAAVPAIAWCAARRRRALLPVVLIAVISMLVVQPVSKELIDRPRPSDELVDVRAEYSSKSFPSGHSLSTTTTWGAGSAWMWRCGRRRVAIAAATPVVLTALASSVQGVHWPSDALAGTVTGALAAWLIVRALAAVERPPDGCTELGGTD